MQKLIKIIIAFIVALIVFVVTQNRIGMTIISFLLVYLLLKEKLGFNLKTLKYVTYAVALFYLGRRVSFFAAGKFVGPIGLCGIGDVLS